jgi:hypothetical protein
MTETVARHRHEALRIRIDRLTHGLDRGVWYWTTKVNIRTAVNDHRADTPRKTRRPRSHRQITRRA